MKWTIADEWRKIHGDWPDAKLPRRNAAPWSDSEDIKQEGGKRLCTNRKASDWMDAVKKAETAFWAAVGAGLLVLSAAAFLLLPWNRDQVPQGARLSILPFSGVEAL